MASILEVSDLSIRFGGIRAVDGVSFSVDQNSFVGLIGPNGAGKTTLINCLSGVYKAEKGKILFQGEDITSFRGDKIVKIGIARTFQDLNFFSLLRNMLVIDYVRLGQFSMTSHSLIADGVQTRASRNQEWETKKRGRRILEFFREMRESLEPPQESRGYPWLYGKEGFADLIDMEYQPLQTLSFAWRRRLDLARALVSQPKLLLLDEPAQGLSPSEIENLGKILEKIRQEFGVSALIVEHNMPLLQDISDQAIVMSSGKKLTEGTPAEVVKNPEVIRIYLGDKSAQKNDKKSDKKSEAIVASRADKSTKPILVVKDLDVAYGNAQALFSVSLELYPQQITTVLGTNGSGKSTLLKAISGLIKTTYGEVEVDGEYLPPGWPQFAAQKSIQFVPQGHLVLPELSVYDNLIIGGYLPSKVKGYDKKAELERVLSYFPQLKDVLKLEATKLSGGQQQMLALAQALMGRPKILLLDEPSLGLAPVYVDAIFSVIERLGKEEGYSILLVEQNVGKALEISDYVYMLNTGVMAGHGPSSKFISDSVLISKQLGFS